MVRENTSGNDTTAQVHVTLHPVVADALKDQDAETVVNSVMVAYLGGCFIKKSDVAGMVTVPNAYKLSYGIGVADFNIITHQFQGVTVSGKEDSESLFIPSPELLELLEENSLVLVMKSPRSAGISQLESPFIFAKPSKENIS